MKIDEAIKHAREVAEENRKQEALENQCELFWNAQKCRRCAEEHEQLANWLEELKWYKSQFTYTEEVVKEMTQQSYNKAIDDFVEYVDEYCLGCGYTDGNYTRVDVIKRCFHSKAEQLKK